MKQIDDLALNNNHSLTHSIYWFELEVVSTFSIHEFHKECSFGM